MQLCENSGSMPKIIMDKRYMRSELFKPLLSVFQSKRIFIDTHEVTGRKAGGDFK